MRLIALIAVLAVFVSSSRGALLGSRRCTWGPAYWCQHVGTMKECNSGEYCAQLWGRSRGPESDASPEECAFCKLLVSDIEKQLTANETESEIREAVERACGVVPQQQLQALCRSVVDTYLPEVLLLLRQKLPPAKVCAALSLCGPGVRDPALAPKPKPEPEAKPKPEAVVVELAVGNGSGLCDDCVKVLQSVKQAVEDNSTEAEIEQLLKDQLCSQLGPLREACDSLVSQYLPQVMQLLDKDIQPKQLCTLLGFCTGGKLEKYKTHPVLQLLLLQKTTKKPLSSIDCELCEALVNEARDLIRQKKTQEEVISFLVRRVCSVVPAEKAQCTSAVQQYGPILFQLLASELDPQTVCQALGACGRSAASAKAPTLPKPEAPKLTPAPRVGPQCIMCEFVIRELDKMLGSNRSQAAIESALEKVCSALPATVGRECDDFVRQYTPVVVQLLTNELSPGLLCTVVGLCAGQQRQLRQAPVNSATVCDVCQTVVIYAKSLLQENATEEEVTQIIEKVCNFLPTQEQAACHSFVEQYAPYVIQLLLQDVHPKQICQTLGLCSSARRHDTTTRHDTTLRFAPNGMVHMGSD